MAAHPVRILCESKDASRTVLDPLTLKKPFWWGGSSVAFQIACVDYRKFLLAQDVGNLIVEVKALDATPATPALMRKIYGLADCDPDFIGSSWGQGKSLLVAEFSAEEAALNPGNYRLIVRHEGPDGGKNTYLSTVVEVIEDQSESESVEAPPLPPTEYFTKGESDARYFSQAASDSRYYGKAASDARYLSVDDLGDSVLARETITILAMGESNMARNTYGPFGPASFDTETDEFVEIWNDTTNQFEIWDLSSDPAQNSQFGPGNSVIPFHFAKELVRREKCIVRVLASGANGLPISSWDTGADQWNVMIDQITDSAVDKVDVILWQQGINNTSDLAYQTKILDLIDRIRALDWFPPGALWIAGYVPESHININAFYRNLASRTAYPGIRVANTLHRPLISGDQNHYDNDAIAEIGRTDYIEAFYDSTAGRPVLDVTSEKFAACYYLDSAFGTYLRGPSSILATFKGSFSVRVNVTKLLKYAASDSTGHHYILEVGRTSNFDGLFALRYSTHSLECWINTLDGSNTYGLTSGPIGITADNFSTEQIITVTRDSTNGRVTMYLNGDQIADGDLSAGVLADASRLTIGVAYDQSYGLLHGLIHGVQIYGRVLTGLEILSATPPTSPALHYRCQSWKKGATDAIPDSSGNGHHGTAVSPSAVTSWEYAFVQMMSRARIR